MGTDAKLNEAIRRYAAERYRRLENMLAWTESPIERLLLLAFLNHGWEPTNMAGYFEVKAATRRHKGFEGERVGARSFARDDAAHALLVQPEVTVRGVRARLDFAFISTETNPAGPRVLVVEADGHDFHERTKEQARRDKQRDRAMTLAKWTVLRFTGSEVYSDADAIAGDVFEALRGDAEDE